MAGGLGRNSRQQQHNSTINKSDEKGNLLMVLSRTSQGTDMSDEINESYLPSGPSIFIDFPPLLLFSLIAF